MNAFEELSRSPLEEDSEPSRTWSWLTSVAVFVVAVAVGWVVVDGLSADSESADTSVPVTTGASELPPAAYPPGYVDAGSSFGIRAESVFHDASSTWVVLSTATKEGVENRSVEGYAGGEWSAAVAGSHIPYQAEYFNLTFPALFTVQFEGHLDLGPDAVVNVRPYSNRASLLATRQATFAGLPWSGEANVSRIELERGVDLVVDEISVDDTHVTVLWRIEAATPVGASLDLSAQLYDDANTLLAGADAVNVISGDDLLWFSTGTQPPGAAHVPYELKAASASSELRVPFAPHTAVFDTAAEYTIKVTLSGFWAQLATDEIVIPLDWTQAHGTAATPVEGSQAETTEPTVDGSVTETTLSTTTSSGAAELPPGVPAGANEAAFAVLGNVLAEDEFRFSEDDYLQVDEVLPIGEVAELDSHIYVTTGTIVDTSSPDHGNPGICWHVVGRDEGKTDCHATSTITEPFQLFTKIGGIRFTGWAHLPEGTTAVVLTQADGAISYQRPITGIAVLPLNSDEQTYTIAGLDDSGRQLWSRSGTVSATP